MFAEISSLISSSKVAYDIAKGVSSLKAEVDRNEGIAKILEILVSVQFQASTVLAKAHELEIEKHSLTKKMMDFEKWNETEKQYKLEEIAPGVFVYSYKTEENSSEPMHWLCAKCYNEKKKSILQRISKSIDGVTYACHTCNKEILDYSKSEHINFTPNRSGGEPNSWMGA